MKLLSIIIALTAAALILPACRIPTQAETAEQRQLAYEAAAASWQGAHISELQAAWARKWFKNQTVLADESTVYTYIWTEEYFRQAEQYFDHAHNEWVDKNQAGVELLVCETAFTTDSQGIITKVRPGGAHCGLASVSPPGRAG